METRIRLSGYFNTDTNFQNVDDSRSTSIGGRKLSQSLPHHVSNTCYHVLYISEMIQISMEILGPVRLQIVPDYFRIVCQIIYTLTILGSHTINAS